MLVSTGIHVLLSFLSKQLDMMTFMANISRGDWSHSQVCPLIAQAPFHSCGKKKKSEDLKRMEPQDERRWVFEWSHGTKPLPQTTSHSAFPLNSASDHSVIVSSCDCRVNSPDHIWRRPFWVSVNKHWGKVAITAAPELLQLYCGIALQSRTFTRLSDVHRLPWWLSW